VIYLVDTNVFSEPVQAKPDPNVIVWLREHASALYVSKITKGKIRPGIERLPSGRRKSQLRAWLVALCDCMKGRVLSFMISTAHVWGQLKAKWDGARVTVPSLVSQISATVHPHQLTVVTRNTTDFAKTGVKVLNPFA
jgi:predicted nucleic acid-binding protein